MRYEDCNKLAEDLRINLLFRDSFLVLQKINEPPASELQLQGILIFNWQVIIKTSYAKTFKICH